MSASEFRAKAREHLSGKWGKAALIVLAYLLITFLLSLVTALFGEESVLSSIISIAITIIEVPLSFGLIVSFFKLYSSEEVKAFDFFSHGFANFKKSWALAFGMLLKLIVPIILLLVSICILVAGIVATTASAIVGSSASGFSIFTLVGTILYIVSFIWLITKTYYYTMSYYVAIDSPELTAKEALDKSREIMTNNRAKLFWLQLTFIGWMILATFTLGIGYFFLLPYMTFAEIAFYYFVAKKEENVAVQEITDNNPETLE